MAFFKTIVLDNQIKALPTIATASGAVATFTTDKAENLVSCVCEVASGKSEVNVNATGKNMLDSSNKSTNEQYCVFGGVLGSNIPNGSLFLPQGNFTLLVSVVMTSIEIRNKDGNVITSASYSDRITFTNPNKQSILIVLRLYGASWNTLTYMLNKGSTPKTYTAYNGNTYNIQLGETLSDTATYNAVTGVLTRNDTTTKQLDSCPIVTIANSENNILSDTGDIEVKFVLSVGEYVNQNV